ncbi:DUF1353 domain-containing protein [Mesorhizobium sp. CO1-1-8]|uniref:DUF1353 domain-containing protein n=1 Tax=Mesorhizobium sp. CO1-1-8 TaxID=2876631 RepID=UPI001CD0D4D3|nr:DUF1353 domain-containing protein [Mesorhizobium sp. CO1-1-8]MBZ9772615.1 DUF1353 domain-containing protein [Mesorhizobium sp. CO1-1-8]
MFGLRQLSHLPVLAKSSAALSIVLMLLAGVRVAHADFVGNLVLLPTGCQSTGHCELGADFGFIDPKGVGWQAAKGLITDGASIPPWAQPIVGKPFDESFVQAAIIHDHYCDRHVRSWRQTHRVFYDALRASAVGSEKAGIMYFAILVGGPKWIKLVKGKPCGVGLGCINQVGASLQLPGTGLSVDENGGLIAVRGAQYGTAKFAKTMADNLPQLEAQGGSLTPEVVEQKASQAMADDVFFANGDETGTTLDIKVDTK